MKMNTSPPLRFHSPKVCSNLTQHSNVNLDLELSNLHSKKGLENSSDHKMEKARSHVWVISNILCTPFLIGSKSSKEMVHIDLLACKHLSYWVMQVTGIDSNP